MADEQSIKRIIDLVNKGKEYPAMSVIKRNPQIAATISKLVTSNVKDRINPQDPNSFYNLSQSNFTEISDSIKERISDSDNTKQLFPDLELAAQILISSILSPKDMVSSDLIYKHDELKLASELSGKIIEVISKALETTYNLSHTLPDILRDILFDTGSHVLAVIPESSVDELINSNQSITLESMTEIISPAHTIVPLGFLGSPLPTKAKSKSIALEAFIDDQPNVENTIYSITDNNTPIPQFNLEVSDNYKLLKLPSLIAANNKHRVYDKLKANNIATEAKELTAKEFESLLYKNKQTNATPIVSIKTQSQTKRKSIGRPLQLKLPSESVIPVFVPGDEKQHIGYFVLIDEEGNPVSKNSNKSYIDDMQASLSNTNTSLSSFLLQKARRNLSATDLRNLNITQATKIYSGIVETDLIERLKNGMYGRKVAVSKDTEIYRIMLARSLANQFTRLVYIPAELVTYFALKYHSNGIGKSLLDDLKILTSLRAILLFAKVMALTKSSIALTHVNMTLDPNDPDPQKTVELAVHEIVKMRQQYFPLGINSPVDLVDWVQRAGFEFTFEGHPGLPQTKFDFETKNLQHTVPDSDLDELLRKQTLMAIGLSPEIVDNGFTAEFATSVVANNILLSKRVTQIQNQFTPQLTQYVQTILRNDTQIKNEIIKTIVDNRNLYRKSLTDEALVAYNEDYHTSINNFYEELVSHISVSLPKPDVTTIQNQTDAYTEYSESLDKTIEAWINSDFMSSDLVGNIGSNMDTMKGVFKAYFLRKWMSENGFMPELNDITSTNEDGDASINLYDIMKLHSEGLVRSSVKYINSLKPISDAANEDLEKMGATANDTPSEDSGSEDSGDDSGAEDDGMGGEDMGMDDFGDTGDDEAADGEEAADDDKEEKE